MLWRIVGKLLLKVTVPLVLVLGVLSYGHYMRGGDPGALWKSIAGSGASRIVGGLNGSLDGVRREAGDAMASIRGGSDVSGSGEKTTVYTWQDVDGVTHFSQSPPAGVSTRTVTVDPNVNVLAPVRLPEPAVDSPDEATAGPSTSIGTTGTAAVAGTATDDLQAIGGMPGIAGQLPSIGGASPEIDSAARTQLIKMLQPSGP